MCCGKKPDKNHFDFTLIDPILADYKNEGDGNLISILQTAQEKFGYLSNDLLLYIAKETGIKPAKIIGVATFYTQFRMKPVGKNLILLCQGTACHVNGSGAIEDAIKAEIGVLEGEITPDGLFTYNNVACLGCCSLAPVMMINDETYGSLTPETTRKIIQNIRNMEDKN
ncbi:MAG: NADH-quinone oxidoreductase subunit NuoE [Lachnospiraceae bacterium]|nr:NADH-quinone oxidoreductase subunit NuoE [Lachnospiraceae bacterium]